VPSLLTVLRDPSARRPDPAPAAVDLGRVLATGTLAWVLVLLGAVVVDATTELDARLWVRVAGAGVALGGLGMAWARRNRARWQSEHD